MRFLRCLNFFFMLDDFQPVFDFHDVFSHNELLGCIGSESNN